MRAVSAFIRFLRCFNTRIIFINTRAGIYEYRLFALSTIPYVSTPTHLPEKFRNDLVEFLGTFNEHEVPPAFVLLE